MEDEDGRYERLDTVEEEKMYSDKVLTEELARAGFSLLARCDGYSEDAPTEESDRVVYVARAVKS